MKRTNIMLADNQRAVLKSYARKEGKTLGELVREAIDMVYQKKDSLEQRQSVALNAYKEGFISLGKLSEILGIDTVSARLYLKQKHLPVRSQDADEIKRDILNA
ncbi:MAG: hypothetical protein A2Z47_14290 [Thermodesulfovibrio sp. RBG_19FT_COMBO_42_12]|nr:MAG: hypothetical protein A2Z47_14290 [Thermodesulfovibrio sp. RBG_19FT_COMBO_42_12]